MKNKLFVGVIGLVMSATMMITASATAAAATCSVCDEDMRVSRVYSHCEYLNPDTHIVVYDETYTCSSLNCDNKYSVESYEYEAHNYDLIEGNNVMMCLGCGDTYSY